MPGAIDHVFLDIGGVLYDDRVYAEAWRRALREAGGTFTDAAFDDEYAACRAGQDRSFRVHLATAFLGLAYHHERRHYERQRGLNESAGTMPR